VDDPTLKMHPGHLTTREVEGVVGLICAIWAWQLWVETYRCRFYYMGQERCVLHMNHTGSCDCG